MHAHTNTPVSASASLALLPNRTGLQTVVLEGENSRGEQQEGEGGYVWSK